jgi:hypothetical protein
LSITPVHLHQFGQRHQLAVGRLHRQGQQRIQPDLGVARQLQAHRHRVFALAVVQVGGVHARERGMHRLRDAATGMPRDSARWRCTAGRHAAARPPERGVDADDVGRRPKALATRCGQLLAAGFVGP